METNEYILPIEGIWNIMDNKYKALVVIGKEARRIFQVNPQSSDNPVVLAIQRFVNGEIVHEEAEE
ncbi:MAG: hypothetical protein COT45_00625 [bacterium (Candidatus Stahlbacteria) CG08_land_8_20_14_0_20_40_26]|nr:MAG: hypothetical protein COT45_00625 [bacterium (Candidatus Stahlbacteria) CG08_land_8_20_14_0_20_40_26]